MHSMVRRELVARFRTFLSFLLFVTYSVRLLDYRFPSMTTISCSTLFPSDDPSSPHQLCCYVCLILGAATWRCAIIVQKKFTRAVWLRVGSKISSFSCQILPLPVCHPASNGKTPWPRTNKRVMKKLPKNSMKSLYPYIYLRWSFSLSRSLACHSRHQIQDHFLSLSSISLAVESHIHFSVCSSRMRTWKPAVHHIIQPWIWTVFG